MFDDNLELRKTVSFALTLIRLTNSGEIQWEKVVLPREKAHPVNTIETEEYHAEKDGQIVIVTAVVNKNISDKNGRPVVIQIDLDLQAKQGLKYRFERCDILHKLLEVIMRKEEPKQEIPQELPKAEADIILRESFGINVDVMPVTSTQNMAFNPTK
ncbi:MAG: hypothetical protein ACRC2T_12030 [Thermoguttaceae bacterium]